MLCIDEIYPALTPPRCECPYMTGTRPVFTNERTLEMLPSGIFLWYESFMCRVRAFILLFALLAGTGSALAQATQGQVLTCCADNMCPLHSHRAMHTTPQEKSANDGVPGFVCNCSSNSESQKVTLPVLPEVVLEFRQVLPALRDSRFDASAIFEPASPGFVLFPEQPPRL
jgi:hypothetical protein